MNDDEARIEAEAEELLDMDGRRERLEQVAADLQSGKVQPVDHATARERIEAATGGPTGSILEVILPSGLVITVRDLPPGES